MTRREFLTRGTKAIIAGIAVGQSSLTVSDRLNTEVRRATGHPAGNAGSYRAAERCARQPTEPDRQQCKIEYFDNPKTIRYSTIEGPFWEELLFRALPSGLVSIGQNRPNPIADILMGTNRLPLTRREWLAGMISSLLFGGLHNYTNNGWDTETVPASQTMAGVVYWVLQRSLGFGANYTAHGLNNWEFYQRSLRHIYGI